MKHPDTDCACDAAANCFLFFLIGFGAYPLFQVQALRPIAVSHCSPNQGDRIAALALVFSGCVGSL